ncbi:lipoyl(octanoyl) transferase LipB [Candidatus Berkiella aquae]|uniref:Octanoyltransferase n=1 Tax=Candidatus Berkiella aquae TaxID=295108 RepID=A0A0Q9YYA6_9GAMM|nr:lipoyl(octanoyl) transferase LipB [Candidatus Berkiella aquae]MCS5710572.1 lipoyl(octanoyl) transferase LipB [Candidatus Berkiella aquae]
MSIEVFQFPHLQHYEPIFEQMREFTLQRNETTPDAIWLLQHEPVFTQGQAGKAEHLLAPGDIPVVQSDRGGQVTYHGPGQLMIYTLCDLKRLNMGIKTFVNHLQQSIIDLLALYGIQGHTQCSAPGVYVDNDKICSIGLRVRRGYTYHGLSLNVSMDLEPFTRINPCGFHQLRMIQIQDFYPTITLPTVIQDLIPILQHRLWRNSHHEK